MTTDVLGPRALNRATLARQLLLERSDMEPVDAVSHLVGMQAQIPLNPYLGLWSRLQGFDPGELGRALEARVLVRIVVMRGTIHLLTADDCLLLRPLCQRVLDGELARHRDVAPVLRGVDVGPVLEFAAELLTARPHSTPELRAALAERFPELDTTALTLTCRNRLALVQVPPRGVWGKRGQVTLATAESWLGRPLAPDPLIDDVVLRYLGAYGPATAADMAAWSRLTGFREVVGRLRPRLRTFRDERGRELVDLPEAPRPDPATPAPVRFLPEYDNALLSHADRSRFAGGQPLTTDGPVHGTVLHDGMVRATWSLERVAGAVIMTVRHAPLPSAAVDDIVGEAERALAFLEPTATSREVQALVV